MKTLIDHTTVVSLSYHTLCALHTGEIIRPLKSWWDVERREDGSLAQIKLAVVMAGPVDVTKKFTDSDDGTDELLMCVTESDSFPQSEYYA